MTPILPVCRMIGLLSFAGVNIIKIRISVLRAFYPFFCKTENKSSYLRNLEYKKRRKIQKHGEKYENTKKVCKIEIRSFITMKNLKIQRKILFLQFYECFIY